MMASIVDALRRSLAASLAVAAAMAPLAAQVELRRCAVVYFGSPTNTSAPAVIDHVRVRDATPEWREVRTHGVRRGTARYRLLTSRMGRRIRAAARQAVSQTGRDLVVRVGDITDARGRDVVRLTDSVIQFL